VITKKGESFEGHHCLELFLGYSPAQNSAHSRTNELSGVARGKVSVSSGTTMLLSLSICQENGVCSSCSGFQVLLDLVFCLEGFGAEKPILETQNHLLVP
jgi:hypothetical protein